MSKTDDRKKLQTALSLHQAGDFGKAASIYQELIKSGNNSHALHYLGVIEAATGNFKQAKSLMARSLATQPLNIQFLENYASVLFQAGDYQSALDACQQGLELNGNAPSLLYICAISLYKTKNFEDSIRHFDRLLSLQPGNIAAINERGSVLAEMRNYEAALASFERALSLQPTYAEAHLNKGNLYARLRRYQEAYSAYDHALALRPDLADAWLGRGNILREFKRHNDAFAAYDRAIALKPEIAGAWLGRGNVLYELERFDEALAAYDRAMSLEPRLAAAWLGCGNVAEKLKRHEAAAAAYARVIELDPAQPCTKGMLLREKMSTCDWDGVEGLTAEIEVDILSGRLSSEPFGWLAASKSMRSSQLCAQLYCATNFPRAADVSSRGSLPEHRALRIGYSAGEFNDHATSYLIAGLLELHDRSRFQIYAVDNGLDDHSEVRRRINASVHQIINIRGLDDTAAVNAIRENEIDILVNLNGYSGRARPGVFALRAAPVQVNYLGFSGTLGAPYIDYIIADPIVLPPDHQKFYDEKVVYLPNCYQVNDRTRPVGTRIPTRAECCLPEKGFVFCCFNNNYKITPDVFSRWARIIEQVSGSVLWLLEDNAGAASNLRMEWSTRGIDPGRLVFAKRAATADHLARHRLADLFLDTSPYGAHTTGSDALWACLPLVTQLGDTFPGRVAASLLHAVGLPELVAATEQDYEQRAVELATNPEQLAAIKLKLAAKRASAPLFDTERFARHVEVAYEMMHERCQAGTPPDHMTVPQQSLQG